VNELAIHAHELGIDIWEVVAAASTKPFGFMPFYPGPGVGGHCLPIDPSYLDWKIERHTGHGSRFVKMANDVNNRMPSYVVDRVMHGLNNRGKATKGAGVLVLGVSYKKNSSDARETPATAVIEGLLRLGAVVSVHDPHVDRYELFDRCERVESLPGELSGFDAVVLVTDHDSVDYERLVSGSSYIFDTRHRLAGENVEHL
jgi:UDP-N-acetyl-D-glucosamine dehydrogenase